MNVKILSACAVVSAGAAFGFELVGVKDCATVVIAENAEDSSVLAAQEITNYVARLTGRVLPIATDVPRSGAAILIGTRERFPAKVPIEALAKLDATTKSESYWIGVAADRMYIV
jgi:hypothetical protein